MPLPSDPVTVTLVSGDRVTLAGPGATTASVEPGPGRAAIGFTTSFAGGRLRVVPSDAAALIAAQRVDPRLFDITALVETGFQDSVRNSVPLILRYGRAQAAGSVEDTVEDTGATVGRDLPAVRGVSVTAPKATAGRLWKELTADADVEHIWLDGVTERRLDVSVPHIGGPAAWQAGFTGAGVTVAVLDGGVDLAHPDLAGRVTTRDFAPLPGPVDGHATHVASIIAGDGAASQGKYRGVAPGARVVNGRVCDSSCSDSALLAGMQWAAVDQHARIISMSIGLEGRYLGENVIDPLIQAVDDLSAQTGALFVVAAGNSGSGDRAETIETPGAADAALTVGAVDSTDATTVFSSRGPRPGDGAIKPDIAAPGLNIMAARASTDTGGTPAPDFPAHYRSMSGTSMATPHVAGAAVLLAQQHPDWDGQQIKATLMAAAKPNPAAGPFEQGNGRVDIARAITQTVTTDPPSLSFGIQRWPHDNAGPVSRDLTYRNTGPVPVTLDLAVAAPFTLSSTRLSVPAGGAASVTVTAGLTADVVPGRYPARVIATGGTVAVSTAVAVEKETERYDLRLRLVGLDGAPADASSHVQITGLDSDYNAVRAGQAGDTTVRVAKGRYALTALVRTAAGDGRTRDASMFQPVVQVEGDTVLTVDARTAPRVIQQVPQAAAVPADSSMDLTMTADGAPFAISARQDDFGDLRVGVIDSGVPGLSDVTATVTGVLTAADEQHSPYAYFLADRVAGMGVLTGGYRRSWAADEFAAESQRVHGDPTDRIVQQQATAWDAAGAVLGSPQVTLAPGRDRVNHYTAGGTAWEISTRAGRLDPDWDIVFGVTWDAPARAYRAGEQTRQDWGRAPLGVVLAAAVPGLTREGDTIWASLSQFGDASGHPGRELIFDGGSPAFTSIMRDGIEVAREEGDFASAGALPDAEAVYTIAQTVTGGRDGLGVERTAAFTFRSARPSDDADTPLPVIWVHATPHLDDHGTATGPVSSVPLTVRDQSGQPAETSVLGLEVSFDDGRTWTATSVTDGAARVEHPGGTGFVSLRMRAENASGSTATQTVIRAYRFTNG